METPDYERVIRAYKKRQKAMQRRISAENGVNKRLVILLKQAQQNLPDGLLSEMIEHELEMLKFKYY